MTFGNQAPPAHPLMATLGRNPTVTQIFETNATFEHSLPEVYKSLQRVQVSFLADMTVHALLEPLTYFSRCFGVEPLIDTLPPYQVDAFLSSGELKPTQLSSRALIVLLDLDKMAKTRATCPASSEQDAFESVLAQRIRLCSAFAKRAGCKVLVSSLFSPYPSLSEAFPCRGEFSRAPFVEHANSLLAELCSDAGLDILPLHRVFATHGLERCLSLRDYLSSDSPFTAEGANRAAESLARQLSALFTRRRKLLVLDLDNTLWKGVLGEDGPDGIKYKPDCFEGRIFWHVLSHVKALADSGIILAINSKNNEHEVLALLDSPSFPLNREDFASIKANWLPKGENLSAISEELGLSLDSMVMLDDSDAECLQLRQGFPEVEVIQVPKKLSDYPAMLASIPFFDRSRITEADTLRKLDYQNLHKRKKLAESASSTDDFLKALSIELTLAPASGAQLDRVEQLFERTNQFNLSGARFKRPQLEELQRAGALVITASYVDSFGPSGVIGALVARQNGGTCHIENFVLSCRVLGRGVEHAIITGLNEGFFQGAISHFTFAFNESGRNTPAKVFLQSLSWVDGMPLSAASIVPSPHIRVAVSDKG